MRLVVQRVISCKVADFDTGKLLGEIGKGLVILLGVGKEDSLKDADFYAEKVTKLRIISDRDGKMNLSAIDSKTEVIVVSQFTLLADTKGGNRPSFINAAEPGKANEIYEYFIKKLRDSGLKVESGKFGAYMRIDAILDGPVTIMYE